ncbi:MAG TPA: molecular chaperone HtpG [Methylomirabilota bacterium]|nr:molecular chaperone HtpG [Methylomirabilota bacterium]
MTEQTERHEFQAEVRELLDLMIHSLYSHKDIFLRELISNASDALDKVRFEALRRPDLTPGELAITLEVDAQARTLAVHDNGIGMTRQEVVEHLGTIARSGTREFLRVIREAKAAAVPELIGQFGVGFYASFMVADRITVVTRRAGTEEATRWESAGDGSYTLGPGERAAGGTTVTLHLKAADEEDGLKDYTQAAVLRDIVKRYSDFVTYPVRLQGETLNSMKAIWARSAEEVTPEEHREFYKHISHDWTDPLEHLSVHMEGSFEARALLYIPAKAPFDLHDRDGGGRGLSLYVKRVFIMDDWRELLPPYLRFVRGVVSADDLSLNVSRELLQKNRQVQAIRKYLVRRLLAALKEMKDQRPDRYRTFWTEFGAVLKEGLLGFEDGQDRLLELVLAASTDGPAPTALGEYVARMKEGQPAVYYLTAPSREAAERSPHLEAFRARGYEVLFFLDPIDELWLRLRREFEGKPLVSVAQGAVDLGPAKDGKPEAPVREDADERFKDLLLALRAALQDEVRDVRLSERLTSSPACLVGEAGDISPHLEELLRRSGREVPKAKRVLELNPTHPLVTRLQAFHAAHPADERFRRYAELLHGQAILAEGGALPDPAGFSRRLAELLVEATGGP